MESLIATKTQSWLSWFLKGALVLAGLILLGRLVELQIIKGGYFRSLAEGNRVKRIPIIAPRGEIVARGGEILASNIEVESADNSEKIIKWERVYPLGSVAAHITGYIGEVNEEEVGKVDGNCSEKGVRKPGTFVGRMGIEEYYDCTLRGRDGEELVEVNTLGDKVRTLGRREPVVGEILKTTIDFNLQKILSEVMKDKKGAVIITDGRGEVLAFYSSPSFDPKDIPASLKNPDLPLFNRVVGGAYHPGSTFKIVTATAALEDKKIDRNFIYEDPGVITVNNFSYSNWYFTQYGGREGAIGLVRAIARSTDTFFYKLGEFVGPNRLASWAERFGLGVKTGIDIPGEITGLVPTPEWKEEAKGEQWFLGNTYHMAIGQGDIALTPLQVNVMTSVVANGGLLCTPHLIDKQEDCKELGIGKDSIKEVRQGMVEACSSGGTGYPFFDFEPSVACKTGTAETEEEDRTHAWFTVFTPSESPQVVVTVLVEKGGEGSSVAAPIAKEILEYWKLINNP